MSAMAGLKNVPPAATARTARTPFLNSPWSSASTTRMSAILIWDRDVNRRALPRRGADRDRSAKLPDAFFDADQPESSMRRLCHVETVAVVLHRELDPVVPV